MAKGKNARKKARKYEQEQRGVVEAKEDKFEFLRKVQDVWGKELIHTRRVLPAAGDAKMTEVTAAFSGIPFIVLGCKGVGNNYKEAEANAAWNFVSFFDNGFISKESIKAIRIKWNSAENEINEIVSVCRLIESHLNTEAYAGLKEVSHMDQNPQEKPWAKHLRNEVKNSLKRREYGFLKDASSTTSSTSIFTEAGQKRKLGENGDGGPSEKKRKNGEASEESANPLPQANASILDSTNDSDVICINDSDSDDDILVEETPEFTKKVSSAAVSLNVSNDDFPVAMPSGGQTVGNGVERTEFLVMWDNLTENAAFGGLDSLASWCETNNIPLDFEKTLLGVEYCGTPASQTKVSKYIERYSDACKQLSDEIWHHYHTNGQNDDVYAWKMKVRELLLREFKHAFPRQNIQMYAVGSTINGCGSYNSDMDLCLCVPREGTHDDFDFDRSSAVRILRKLNGMTRGVPGLRRLVKRSQVIPAKVPIMKVDLMPPYEELDLDININNTPGIYNSHLVHYYSRVDSRFPALGLLVKHWAIANGISDAMSGTFNSYSLILLVLHYLQCGVQPAVLPNLQYLFASKFAEMPPLSELMLYQDLQGLPKRPPNVATVGELLMGFFHYYSSFDFSTWAISIRNAKRFSRRSMPYETHHFQIYIEEPFDGKNTARCVTKAHCMSAIRTAFQRASLMFSDRKPNLKNIQVNV